MKYTLEGLNCPQCTLKIENKLKKIPGLEHCSINFVTKSVDLHPAYVPQVQEIINTIEPGVVLTPIKNGHRFRGQPSGKKKQEEQSSVNKACARESLFPPF